MYGRIVVNGLRGVEPQAVEPKLLDPVGGVADEIVTYGRRGGTVEVERVAPLVRMLRGKILASVLREYASVRPEMVVDHIEDHCQAQAVSRIDEETEIIGRTVETRR